MSVANQESIAPLSATKLNADRTHSAKETFLQTSCGQEKPLQEEAGEWRAVHDATNQIVAHAIIRSQRESIKEDLNAVRPSLHSSSSDDASCAAGVTPQGNEMEDVPMQQLALHMRENAVMDSTSPPPLPTGVVMTTTPTPPSQPSEPNPTTV